MRFILDLIFAVSSDLTVILDDVPLEDLVSYRTLSPLFTVDGVDAVSDGYWIMLRPLSAGEHTLEFGGGIDLAALGGPVLPVSVTYKLTVE